MGGAAGASDSPPPPPPPPPLTAFEVEMAQACVRRAQLEPDLPRRTLVSSITGTGHLGICLQLLRLIRALVSEPSCTHGSTARVAPLAVCTVARTWALLGLVSVVRRPTTRSFRPARVRSADTSIAVEAVKVVVVLVVFALAILWYARE